MIHKIGFLLLSLIITGCNLSTDDPKDAVEEYISLKGDWKFSIGDDPEWADPDYNDIDWVEINVPSAWEDEGFHGYNGYAWYRRAFEVPADYGKINLYLHLGYIDDVDEVYVNGILVGRSGSFPPVYNSAYNAYRKYYVPGDILNINDDNIIAVRVYDSQLAGGMTSGKVGFYINPGEIIPDIDLAGKWKFRTGNDLAWKEGEYNDSVWVDIIVPGYWENQGFRDYDGFAWYRKEFNLTLKKEKDKYVLLLGKIDDIDEVYLNGALIGSTGSFKEDTVEIFYNEYSSLRGYYIPDSTINEGRNTIAVRVYDGYKDGGIYEGPLGLVKQEKYTSYWNERKKRKGFFD